GHLSREGIGRMVNEADKYSAEDEHAAARITSNNTLESYSYNLPKYLNDEKLAGKFEAGDKTQLETAVNETIAWLDTSQMGSKEGYEEKQKELEAITNPVIQKLYGWAEHPADSRRHAQRRCPRWRPPWRIRGRPQRRGS
ncbi:hypothetical protein HYPSUDRAFT_1067363, partial [Hypholoma sublateritium FD-334 SS-4]